MTRPELDRDGATVRFWAARSAFACWRSFFIVTMLLGPFAFIAPDLFIGATLAGAALAWLNARAFRFMVSDRSIEIKGGAFVPAVSIALDEVRAVHVEEAEAAEDDEERVGTLVLRLAGGRQVPVSGIVEPVEAANAVRALMARRATAPVAAWDAHTA